MSNAAKRKRRHRLFVKQRGLCHWCGCKCVEPTGASGRLQPNNATIDHLDDRFSAERGAFFSGNVERTVMACYACNHRRAEESQRAQPKEMLWKRSHRAPRNRAPALNPGTANAEGATLPCV